MSIIRRGLLAGFLALSGPAAFAAELTTNCDQFQTYPNYPGPGPVYEGTSPVPNPAPGIRPVLQWTCFFKIRTRIVSVAATVVDAKGNSAPFPQYDVTFDYNYYPDQTAIKLSFQQLPSRRAPLGKSKYSVVYKITFEKEASSPPTASAGNISCYNRICTYINSKGETYYVDLNDNSVIARAAVPGAKVPVSVYCSVLSNPEERCAAIDSTGQIWRINLRPVNGPTNVWSPAQAPGVGQKGPFSIACDNTRYCLVVNGTGQTWKGPFETNEPFVGGPQLPP